jgi:hypothetical protein
MLAVAQARQVGCALVRSSLLEGSPLRESCHPVPGQAAADDQKDISGPLGTCKNVER